MIPSPIPMMWVLLIIPGIVLVAGLLFVMVGTVMGIAKYVEQNRRKRK